MKKSTMILFTVLAVLLIAAGLAVGGGLGWHWSPGSGGYETLGTWSAGEIAGLRAELDELSLRVYENHDKKTLEISGSGRGIKYVDIQAENGVLTLRETAPTGLARLFSYDHYKDYVIIWLPRDYAGELALSSGSGEVSMGNLRAVGLQASVAVGSGSADIYDARLGGLTLASESGRLWVGSAEAGALTVSAGSGDISLSQTEISGSASLSAGSGSVSVTQGEYGALALRTGSGSIWVDSVTAERLAAATTSGSTNVRECELGALAAESGSGYFHAEYLQAGTVTVTAGSGSVRLNDSEITGEGSALSAGSGGVALSECAFPTLTVETDSGDVRLEELRADSLRIATGSGDITGSVKGLTGTPAVDASSVSGDVRLDH